MKTAARRLALSGALAMTAVVGAPIAAHADDVPDPKPVLPGGVSAKTDLLLNILMGIGVVAIVAGFILAGILMAVGKDSGHGGRQGTDRLWMVAIGAIVIGSASAMTKFLFA